MNQETLTGRTLDAAIAERVMGFTRAPDPPHPTDNRAIDGVLYYLPDRPWDVGQQNIVPYFSSDIAAAMLVIDKADTWILAGGQGKVTASFGREQDNGDLRYVNRTAPTAAEAICLAALAARN